MANLKEGAKVEQIEDFLMYHIDNADSRKSKVNPSLTKADVWNINMGAIQSGNVDRAINILIRNLMREFGSYYEEN
ncbi:hypothetical protein EV204_105235 [Tissierella praeacuta]|uniref:hypothetical protein n=1 Tax=Tissierella praeacuta TaxID=43131 RepID=UPI00104652F3|nr:hypothetical protein [Tissierella praeacuta]TCU72899.1 hypothetical protein EV204_105235 [Tissierella praeacuta]